MCLLTSICTRHDGASEEMDAFAAAITRDCTRLARRLVHLCDCFVFPACFLWCGLGCMQLLGEACMIVKRRGVGGLPSCLQAA